MTCDCSIDQNIQYIFMAKRQNKINIEICRSTTPGKRVILCRGHCQSKNWNCQIRKSWPNLVLQNSVLKLCLAEEPFSVSLQFFHMSPQRGHNYVTGHMQDFTFCSSHGCYIRKWHTYSLHLKSNSNAISTATHETIKSDLDSMLVQ